MDEANKHRNQLGKLGPNDVDAGSEDHVYVSANEMVVQYKPFAEIERWVKYRLAEKSKNKTRYIFWMIVLFFLFGGPLFVAKLMEIIVNAFIIHSTGPASAQAITGGTLSIVAYFYAFVAAIVSGAMAVYFSQPTHLRLTDRGVQLLWWHRFKGLRWLKSTPINGKLLAWNRFSRIVVEKPPGKESPSDFQLSFMHGSARELKLRLGAFWTTEDRCRVLEAIERWAPELPRDAEVIAALEPPADHSYTELWMKALSAPPKRERLKPLAQDSFLRDGKYRVGGALGVGGQGTAYVAYDLGADNRSVVLKEFILPVYVDIAVRKQALDKFEREAKILKQLDHRQIVKLIDFFVEDHRGYLVLEHIDGVNLRQKVEQEGKLEEAEVRSLAAQMCEILKYLHGLTPPVVHRDFTPDNLILRKDGTLKLVDFNVAQKTDSTATGTVVGKHSYLPPEQFRGLPTTQSDIYAMGATLYYLLTAEDPEPISVARPREINPSVSTQLDEIIAHATAIDMSTRYADAAAILDDLALSGDRTGSAHD